MDDGIVARIFMEMELLWSGCGKEDVFECSAPSQATTPSIALNGANLASENPATKWAPCLTGKSTPGILPKKAWQCHSTLTFSLPVLKERKLSRSP